MIYLLTYLLTSTITHTSNQLIATRQGVKLVIKSLAFYSRYAINTLVMVLFCFFIIFLFFNFTLCINVNIAPHAIQRLIFISECNYARRTSSFTFM